MTFLALGWLRKNINLVLLLFAATCLAVALGKVIRGGTWTLLLPVSLAGVVCGWGLGSSRLTPKQAWASLIVVGVPGVFIYVSGLALPLGKSLAGTLELIPQIIQWLYERTPVDAGPMLAAWGEMFSYAGNVLVRIWLWCVALVRGGSVVDPIAVAGVWNLLIWVSGSWSGWQLRRNRQALRALVPGGVLLALVIDYTRGDTSLVIVYLAIMLVLVGVTKNQWLQARWENRKVDYSESVVFDTLLMVGMVTIGLVLSAAGTPSFSWRAFLDTLRERNQPGQSQVAESLGLEAPPNVAGDAVYWSDGLPRQHLLDTPPEQLKDVVLVVSTGEIPPVPEGAFTVHPQRYYWRAITYDIYTGDGWRSSGAQESEVPAGTTLLDLPTGYRVLNQHIVRAPDENAYVFWAGLLAQTDADVKIAWRTAPPEDPTPAFDGDMLGALTAPDEYSVVSYLPQIDPTQLRSAGSDYPSAISRRYLRLPDSVPERVLGLAREVTGTALTPYDRAVAIETYLRHFPYTLEVSPPPAGRDVVDYFLFTAQQGYCDYYASAMVVLARAAGLPARIVVGYTSGEYDAAKAEYIIRKENAHSWTEVYFPKYGWVEFEPTASQPAIHKPDEESAAGLPPSLSPGQQALIWLEARWRGLVSGLGGQLFMAGSGLVVLLVLWQMGEIGFLNLIPSKRAVFRMYLQMEKASSRLLPDMRGGHTPYQLQTALIQRLRHQENRWLGALFSGTDHAIKEVVKLYVDQSYNSNQPERSLVKRGILSWVQLRWRLWLAKSWFG